MGVEDGLAACLIARSKTSVGDRRLAEIEDPLTISCARTPTLAQSLNRYGE
jgi:hypothetical protein